MDNTAEITMQSIVKRVLVPREAPYCSKPILWLEDLFQNPEFKIDLIRMSFGSLEQPADGPDLDHLCKASTFEVCGMLHNRHVSIHIFRQNAIMELWYEVESETEPIDWDAIKKAMRLA